MLRAFWYLGLLQGYLGPCPERQTSLSPHSEWPQDTVMVSVMMRPHLALCKAHFFASQFSDKHLLNLKHQQGYGYAPSQGKPHSVLIN